MLALTKAAGALALLALLDPAEAFHGSLSAARLGAAPHASNPPPACVTARMLGKQRGAVIMRKSCCYPPISLPFPCRAQLF